MLPLLFILVIEGLGLLIEDAKRNGKIKGIKILSHLFPTHLLFADGVILFVLGSFEDWIAFKVLLDTFSAASGMCINIAKSIFLHNDLDVSLLERITGLLPYRFAHLNQGFNYLGYFLKPSGYLVKDWHWLISKFEKRISHWTYRLLSMGGRLVLI